MGYQTYLSMRLRDFQKMSEKELYSIANQFTVASNRRIGHLKKYGIEASKNPGYKTNKQGYLDKIERGKSKDYYLRKIKSSRAFLNEKRNTVKEAKYEQKVLHLDKEAYILYRKHADFIWSQVEDLSKKYQYDSDRMIMQFEEYLNSYKNDPAKALNMIRDKAEELKTKKKIENKLAFETLQKLNASPHIVNDDDLRNLPEFKDIYGG